jgi:hypothetical protein
MAALLEPSQAIKREELADYISIVDAKSTPFISMAPKEAELGNTYFRWSAAVYDSPKGTASSVPDGTAAGTAESTNRLELTNYGQVFRRVVGVGFLAQAVPDVAGVGKRKEIQWQTARKLVELKRDMEAAFLSTDQNAVADNGTVGYLTKGMSEFLEADGGPSVCTVPSGARTASAAIDATASASLAETNIQAVLTAIYGNTGVVGNFDLLCGTALKRAFTALTKAAATTTGATNVYTTQAVRTFTMDIATDVFKQSISVFEGDFGRLNLVPDNFIGTTTTSSGTALVVQNYRGYVIDWDLVAIRYGILPNVEDLPNDGSGPKKNIQAFAGLVVKNPAGLGKFFATS